MTPHQEASEIVGTAVRALAELQRLLERGPLPVKPEPTIRITVDNSVWHVLLADGRQLSGPSSGDWGSRGDGPCHIGIPHAQNDLNCALIAIEKLLGEELPGDGVDEDMIYVALTQAQARRFSTSDEFRSYVRGREDALAAITDHRNLNRRCGLTPFLYGMILRVESPAEYAEHAELLLAEELEDRR